jgi:hypothetical protein
MKLLAKCEAKRRKDAGGYGKGWPANYVLRWVKGIEWRLFRNLVESWLANGDESSGDESAGERSRVRDGAAWEKV